MREGVVSLIIGLAFVIVFTISHTLLYSQRSADDIVMFMLFKGSGWGGRGGIAVGYGYIIYGFFRLGYILISGGQKGSPIK